MKREAELLQSLLGSIEKDNGELLDCLSAVALGRGWEEWHARIFACWAAGASKGSRNREGNVYSNLSFDLSEPFHRTRLFILESSGHVDRCRPCTALAAVPAPLYVILRFTFTHVFDKASTDLTALFLMIMTYFAPPSPAHELAMSPPFVKSISTYISHIDPSVRRCGMLVAEEVAKTAGKSLDFGGWEGDEQGRAWSRRLRELLKQCDVDADSWIEEQDESATPVSPKARVSVNEATEEPAKASIELPTAGYDSDDSLTGYASPASSRSASPTPSELDEIEKDPSLRVGIKKVPRPVYLAQLGELVRSTGGAQGGDEQNAATEMEVALEVAEELIRRKSGYGTELGE